LTRPETEQAKNGWLLNSVAELCVKRAKGEAMRRSLSDISPVLTVRDLSNYLRVHPSTVYRLLKTGQLPAVKVGRDWRFNVEAIDCWRVDREKNPAQVPKSTAGQAT
jgi:excisionase family DNA binding protein